MPRGKWYSLLKEKGKCTACGVRNAELDRVLCIICIEKSRERAKKYNKTVKVKQQKAAYRKAHPRKYDRERERERAYRIRQRILKLGGNKCVRCGMDDWRTLQVDHVAGGGCREARVKDLGVTLIAHMFVLGKLQVLCANCNWIKRYENSEHRQRAT